MVTLIDICIKLPVCYHGYRFNLDYLNPLNLLVYIVIPVDHSSFWTCPRPGLRDLLPDGGHGYILDAIKQGNIGRFFNHSCDPNCVVQNVFYRTHDIRFSTIALFTKKTVKAFQELRWDYGYSVGSVEGRKLLCKCGSANCRKRLLWFLFCNSVLRDEPPNVQLDYLPACQVSLSVTWNIFLPFSNLAEKFIMSHTVSTSLITHYYLSENIRKKKKNGSSVTWLSCDIHLVIGRNWKLT